jgi:hypothetical protein
MPSLAGGGPALKAHGCPQFSAKIGSPLAAVRRSAPLRVPDSRSAARRRMDVLVSKAGHRKDDISDTAQSIGAGSIDAISALIAGLESEFGRAAGAGLADRFLAAEDMDFHWDMRRFERILGRYHSVDEEEFDLDRVAIVGLLDGAWFTATIIVDGDGNANGMIARRSFRSEEAAIEAGMMRADWWASDQEERRQLRVAPPGFAGLGTSGQGREKGGGGWQESGRPSSGPPCDCLHIVFSRDWGLRARDYREGTTEFLWFSATFREIRPSYCVPGRPQ